MRPVSMPMPRVNASWSQPGGLPSNNPGHLALSSRDQFRSLIDRPCHYCGTKPACGVDRRDNSLAYTRDNSLPCCSLCNYAKRDMSEPDFIAWVQKVFRHLTDASARTSRIGAP